MSEPVTHQEQSSNNKPKGLTEDDRIIALDAELNHRRKCHQPVYLRKWLCNLIYLHEIDRLGMRHECERALLKDRYEHLKYRSWFAYEYDIDSGQRELILHCRHEKSVYASVVKEIYLKSRLNTMGVPFERVAGAILISVIARYIMSASSSRPGKLMAKRIDQSLTQFMNDSQKESYMDAVLRAIYQSCMGPEVLNDLPLGESRAFFKTRGGRALQRKIDREFDRLLPKKSKGLSLALSWVGRQGEWRHLRRRIVIQKQRGKAVAAGKPAAPGFRR